MNILSHPSISRLLTVFSGNSDYNHRTAELQLQTVTSFQICNLKKKNHSWVRERRVLMWPNNLLNKSPKLDFLFCVNTFTSIKCYRKKFNWGVLINLILSKLIVYCFSVRLFPEKIIKKQILIWKKILLVIFSENMAFGLTGAIKRFKGIILKLPWNISYSTCTRILIL